MAQHRTFLTPAQREELLKKILSGEVAEIKLSQPEPARDKNQIPATHETAKENSSTPTNQTSSTTIKEIKGIVLTAGLLILLLIAIAIVNAKTPLINQASSKLGTFLSI